MIEQKKHRGTVALLVYYNEDIIFVRYEGNTIFNRRA
jgi:hypothetical protein